MTNSNKQHNSELVDQILAHLQDDPTPQEITNRLDAATDDYPRQTNDSIDCTTLKMELARFIQYLYKHGLMPPRQVSHQAALAEAIYLLDSSYTDVRWDGYEAAYLDATVEEGLEMLFRHLTETIKEQEIRKFTNWKYSTLIDPTDRNLHYHIVQELTGRYDRLLPNQGKTGGPDYWNKYYLDLLKTVKDSIDLTNQIITGT